MSKKFELFFIGLVQPEFVGCGGSWVLLVITANLFKTTVLLHHLSLPCYIRAPSNGHIPAIQAFNYLKHVITTTPVLALPEFKQVFIVECDARHSGIGAVLLQVN